MRRLNGFVYGLITLLLLAACGGGGNGNQNPRVPFSNLVSFGDSLSDVGSYQVGAVAQLGGGLYTVNSATALNWTQVLAAQMGLSKPCAAQTGLAGDANDGLNVPVQNHPNCRNYAQGGSRVLHPYGPGNVHLGGANATLGELTVPIVTQISNHLGVVNGSFSGTELVTVFAGANDLFMQFGALSALGAGQNAFMTYAVGIANWSTSDANNVWTAFGGTNLAAATQAAAPVMVQQMASVGTALANLVKTQIVANGAKYTLVLNMPNVSRTPFAATLNADPATNTVLAGILDSMTQAFNSALQTGLNGTAGVKYGDVYSTNTDQFNHPAQYGLSNVTSPACKLDQASNILGSSLICTTTAPFSNVIAGDISTYLFADDVHPTPYGYKLLAQEAAKHLALAGWM
jgi:outer membrane lipase/esterase